MYDTIKNFVLFVIILACVPVQWIVRLLPRADDVWIFGSWFGQRFADNPKYLYLYLLKEQPDIRAVWLSSRASVVAQVRRHGGKANLSYSPTGIYYQLRAGVAVISVSLADVGLAFTAGAKIVQLWHGTPLKRIGQDDERFSGGVRGILGPIWRLRNYMLLREWRGYHLLPVPSGEAQQLFSQAFAIPKERVPILGYPRNDLFFKGGLEDARVEVGMSIGRDIEDRAKIIAYLPTHRKEGRGQLAPFPFDDYDERVLEEFLCARNALLVYKAHFYHFQPSSAGTALGDRRIVSPHGDLDTQSLLMAADILVTDLSSCYFDYLLRGRPIAFIASEIDEYVNSERRLYYQYEEVTPGKHVRSMRELVSALDDYLSDPQLDATARCAIRDRFNSYLDGRNSNRVYQYIRTSMK